MQKQDELAKKIGARLRQLRKLKEQTQEELAENAGINAKYYVQIERGRRNLSIGCLQKIAAGLDVPLHLLLQFTETPTLSAEEEEDITLMIGLLAKKNRKTVRAVKALLSELVR